MIRIIAPAIGMIALATALLASFAVAPALAAQDTIYYTSPLVLKDDSGIQIELQDVVASDTPKGSYGYEYYPPSQYRFYVLYYTRYNPTDHDIRYQFNISFVDSNGTLYRTEDNTLATGIGAGRRVSDEIKEFPILRNATGLYLKWYHLNTYINQYEWTNIALEAQQPATPTPTPTAAPTATPAPTPSPSPSPTSKPVPVNGLLPLLAICIAGCLGLAYARRTSKRK